MKNSSVAENHSLTTEVPSGTMPIPKGKVELLFPKAEDDCEQTMVYREFINVLAAILVKYAGNN